MCVRAHTQQMENQLKPEPSKRSRKQKKQKTQTKNERKMQKEKKKAHTQNNNQNSTMQRQNNVRAITENQQRAAKRNKEWCILCAATEIYGSSMHLTETQIKTHCIYSVQAH